MTNYVLFIDEVYLSISNDFSWHLIWQETGAYYCAGNINKIKGSYHFTNIAWKGIIGASNTG